MEPVNRTQGQRTGGVEGQINNAVRKAIKGELRPIAKRKVEKTHDIRPYFPETFVERYEELLDLIFGASRGFGQPGKMDLAGKGKGSAIGDNYITSDGGIKSEKAIHYRRFVDRRLRELSRDIRAWLDGVERNKKLTKNCTVCGKFVSPTWLFCSWCGLDLDD